MRFLKYFKKKIQNEKGFCISSIKSNHGGEFDNNVFESFCNEHSIFHNFSSPRTPQQNKVVEKKNKSFQEITRIILKVVYQKDFRQK